MICFTSIIDRLRRGRDDRGASAVEYGLVIAAIASLIVIAAFALGGVVSQNYEDTCVGLAGQQDPAGQCGGTEPAL